MLRSQTLHTRKRHINFDECVSRFRNIEGFKSTPYNLDKYHQGAIKLQHLCPIDLLIKEHKSPSASGLSTRAIITNKNYFTCEDSNFLYCMLALKVFSHPCVLLDPVRAQDSLSFVLMLDTGKLDAVRRQSQIRKL
jgi:hypothetical protein